MQELLGILIDNGFGDQARIIADIFHEEECLNYLDKLILMDRSERKGFPEDVMSALFRLKELHSGLFKHEQTDRWHLR